MTRSRIARVGFGASERRHLLPRSDRPDEPRPGVLPHDPPRSGGRGRRHRRSWLVLDLTGLQPRPLGTPGPRHAATSSAGCRRSSCCSARRAPLDRERGDGAERRRRPRRPTRRRGHAVREGRAGAVAAVVREDRREHGDAEDAAELADRVVRARRLALLLRPHRREDDVRDRREEERHADARRSMNGSTRSSTATSASRRPRSTRARSPAARARRPSAAGRRSGRRSRPRSARRRSASPSTAGCAGPTRTASSPARSGRTARAGRSSRTSRRT